MRGARAVACLDDRDRPQQPRQRVLLVVHPGLAVSEPGALDAARPPCILGVAVIGLRPHGEPGDAARALRDRVAQVGKPWVAARDEPPPGESLADVP